MSQDPGYNPGDSRRMHNIRNHLSVIIGFCDLLLGEIATARPLVSPHLAYSVETTEHLATMATAKRLHDRIGISEAETDDVDLPTAAPVAVG